MGRPCGGDVAAFAGVCVVAGVREGYFCGFYGKGVVGVAFIPSTTRDRLHAAFGTEGAVACLRSVLGFRENECVEVCVIR